jgi:hypothetical protein
MIATMETLSKLQKQDIRLIGKFVEVYCNGKHQPREKLPFNLPENLGERQLCDECADFMEYSVARRLKCPLEVEKPSCKHCRIHCYAPKQREKIREIMSYAGKKMMMRGRLDYIWHYFF